jgi:hypothetical protein
MRGSGCPEKFVCVFPIERLRDGLHPFRVLPEVPGAAILTGGDIGIDYRVLARKLLVIVAPRDVPIGPARR